MYRTVSQLLAFAALFLSSIPLAFAQSERNVSTQNQQGKQPNILFLFADDQRTDTIGAYGNAIIQTPNIDRLAKSGFNFRNTYCFGSPHGAVCMPSRAMLHTGRSLFHLNDLQMKDHRTLGQILGENGYQTFGTGKWHNGKDSFSRSFQKGENIMFGGMSDHSKVPIVKMTTSRENFSQVTEGPNFSSKLFADAAIRFLQTRDEEKPFFCYVSFTAPHDPRMSPGAFNRMYEPDEMSVPANFLPQHPFDNGQLTTRDEKLGAWPRTEELVNNQTAEYYGLISHLDEQIGHILKTLEETGEAENTIVIYAADHGLGMGSHGLLGKQSLYEHSMKAPLIINGPGIEHGTSQALVYLHDLFPTLLESSSVDVPDDTDGESLSPFIDEESYPGREYLFLTYGNLMRAIRNDRYKIIQYPQINRTQFFDLEADPHEKVDMVLSGKALKIKDFHDLQLLLPEAQTLHGDTQPLTVENPKDAVIDLSGRERKPDQWQPDWIVEKYFDGDKADNSPNKTQDRNKDK